MLKTCCRCRIIYVLAALSLVLNCFRSQAEEPARRVVVVVWDAMRPDFVTKENSPNLWALGQRGVRFANHHSVYLSATEVNGTAISTGAWPVHSGIMANHEYRPTIDPLKPINTEVLAAVRKGDKATHGHYLKLPTLAELLRQSGRRTVVAGAKPVALLADRAERDTAANGVNVFAAASVPPEIATNLLMTLGAFPKEDSTNRTRNDWTTDALVTSLWAESVPDFTFLWLNQPDAAQHATRPGSATALAAIRNADDNFGKVLQALKAKGLLETTDILVVSDHGCSTVSTKADLAADLKAAGIQAVREFKEKPGKGEVLVVSNSGSTLVYVIGHQQSVIGRVVQFLQEWPYTGVIFTRDALPGTFGLDAAHIQTEDAPDIVVSLRWTSEQNKFGAPGTLVTDNSAAIGRGSHVSLSPYDMHNTLVAAGPDFRSGVISKLPSGNVDIAPTVLKILGLDVPKNMDGRVLSEALKNGGKPAKSKTPPLLETSVNLSGKTWRQYLRRSEVDGVVYCDEGNAR